MKHHIRMYYDENHVFHLCPRDTIGSILLKHLESDLATHGLKVIKIHTEIPPQLPAPKP